MSFEQPRYYEFDGKRYPSVTTILGIIRKPQLEAWRGNLGNIEADRVAREAADLGTAVHECVSRFHAGVRVRPRSPVREIFEAYRTWFDATVQEVITSETVVRSGRYRYAGTTDLVALLKGDRKPAVIDIKTSRDIYPDHALQLAAYRAALIEQGNDVDRRLNVWLDKRNPGSPAKAKEWPKRHHDRDYRLFLYAKELWAYFQGGATNGN